MTGNNLRYGGDIERRVLPIRLVPTVENPEERTGFKHPNLLAWVRQNRPQLAVAALTMLRAYVVAGRPEQPGGTWGSYEEWSELIRGSIVWAGLADPLPTRLTAKADDASGAIVRGLIGGLIELDEHGDGLTVREMVTMLNDPNNAERFPAMREVVSEVATSRGAIDQRRLGYAFRKYRGRIANGWRIVGEQNRTGVQCWKAESATAGDAGDAGDVFPDLIRGGVCVTHIDAHVSHTYTDGDGLEVSPACPASPAPSDVDDDLEWLTTGEF